jgi:DNA-3-methyladenine glycosylase II
MSQKYFIPKPSNFSFDETLWFLDRDLDDVSHTVIGRTVHKAFRHKGKSCLIEIGDNGTDLVITVLKGKMEDQDFLFQYINEWFDLDRDIRPFYKLLRSDKDLAILEKKYKGLRIVGIPDFFELLCWCVIGQQINLDFAYTIKRRLVERFGEKLRFGQREYHVFPEPKDIMNLEVEELKAFQMTGKKAEYLIGIAGLFYSGQLSKEKISTLPSEEEMLSELMKVRGIGEWTANYTIMKGFRAMNGVPYGDSGVNNALFNLKGIPKKNNRAEVEAVFQKFEGWKTYLVFYLWRSLRNQVGLAPRMPKD